MEPKSPPHCWVDPTCRHLPSLLSSFIDTFVDFSVSGGLFLPSNPKPTNPNPSPSPTRILAIGDLHGDLAKSLQTLTLASLIDPLSLRWSAPSDCVAVQVGDVLDRGGDELKLIYLLHRLKLQSHGRLITILGNHEVMNIDGDFRYVAPEALTEFQNWAFWYKNGIFMKKLCPALGPSPQDPFKGIPKSFPGIKKEFWEGFRARIAALRPNGPISGRFLADNKTVVVVGDSVFVHGGLSGEHVNYGIEKINSEVSDWIRGLRGSLSPRNVRGGDSVVWLRRFSDGYCDCKSLEKVLGMIPGAKRMVMGHTIQEQGINGVCEDRAIRVDVGLSRGCGNGLPEVLEISNGKQLRILTANPLYDMRRYASRRVKEGMPMLVREAGGLKEVETKP